MKMPNGNAKQPRFDAFHPAFGTRPALLVIGLCCLAGGCADKSYNQNGYDRQNDALQDPMHYGPKPGEFGKDMPDVTRGGIGDSDKEGLHRDLNRVFNP